ncbi:45090_t:CDS:10 [Gigaspora margarita]|uniref:45090_t:CDS:1 n=1 Tax=Gigaspora margarita TaxID=4874 RepID=A0ABN7V5V2_GIGMA|nr:45090_t:CDS:10 [Gigaspora margarita]
MPEKRIQIGNSQDGCLVKKIDPKLEVLMLYNNLQEISLAEDTLPSTAGYYHYQTKNEKQNWISLLPRYLEDNFKKLKEINSDYSLFKNIWTRINPSTKCSLPQFLGFLDNDNINFLKATIATHYPSLYQENQPLINTKKYEILLQKKLKKKAKEINTLIDTEKQLESKFEQSFEDNDLIGDNLLETSINEAIEFNQLVLIKSCSNCNNSGLQNKTWNISSIGFQVKCIIECKKCNDIYEHTNEKEIWFAKAIAATGLTRGISHNTLQSSLATIGITSQIGKKMYNNYQKLYFPSLIACAKSSTTQALQKCIEFAVNQNKEALAIGFDCLWAHVRNANQAKYFYKPIVAFHVVQKSRSIKDNKTELTKTIHQENFDKSSRQMEHAILIEVLNQIRPLLEENNLYLDICVDVAFIQQKLKREAKDQSAPSEAETHEMQVDSLIRYLQNNYSKNQINLFKKFLEKIFCVPVGQSIVISSQTSQNEAFNQTYLLSELPEIYSRQCFELEDTFNIGIIEYKCSEQNKSNNIMLQNEINKSTSSMDIDKIISLDNQIKTIAEKISKFTDLRPEQIDAINYYIGKNKDTLIIMKTGIPCEYLLASSQGTVECEEKVCEEIALGFTHLLFVTPKNLLLNKSLIILCKHLHENESYSS